MGSLFLRRVWKFLPVRNVYRRGGSEMAIYGPNWAIFEANHVCEVHCNRKWGIAPNSDDVSSANIRQPIFHANPLIHFDPLRRGVTHWMVMAAPMSASAPRAGRESSASKLIYPLSMLQFGPMWGALRT
jgi:hypothetical protein